MDARLSPLADFVVAICETIPGYVVFDVLLFPWSCTVKNNDPCVNYTRNNTAYFVFSFFA